MFTVHLTALQYKGNLAAAMLNEGTAEPEFLHLAYENEPNVRVGDDVEVVVHGENGEETRDVGEVVSVREPPQKRSHEENQRVRAGLDAIRDQLIQNGVDPSLLRNDERDEENMQSQWYLLVRHKERKSATT